jgi:hypothetical protein
MGAGRVVYQDLTRITKSIQDGDFFENPALMAAVENCKKNDSTLHMCGLISPGGVHSHTDHLYALLELAKRNGLTKVFVHCFLDGRDTPPAAAKEYVATLEEKMAEIGIVLNVGRQIPGRMVVIEGGLEKRPSNVLIYATSNRRHLIRESFSDRDGAEIGDKHHGDTVQEKLSLANRFGVSIYYGAPTYEEYQEIVLSLARRNGIAMDQEQLRKEATRWEMTNGGLSGRTAQQFINYLLGTELADPAAASGKTAENGGKGDGQ